MSSIDPLRDETGRLAALFHHGWVPPVLGELHRGGGAKTVTLLRRLDAPRDSVRRTLDHLVAAGLVRRNPGHGHPLRPEWILTAAGERLGPACADLLDAARHAGLDDTARRKWTCPVLLAVLGGRDHWSAIDAAVPGVSPRALAQALRRSEDAGAIFRREFSRPGPDVTYRPAPRARPLEAPLQRLAAVAVPVLS